MKQPHIVRIKEKSGREWVTIMENEFPFKDIAMGYFKSKLREYLTHDHYPVSITWSEGSKVHGTFRIN